ncbi:MAG TPA: type IV pilus secretin PilQ [Terriglobales bacterium]|jgi:type IV pilus assembly protein PilQ|nr:type IV pilus secretin PilQ [Terriglobales bacterium]
MKLKFMQLVGMLSMLFAASALAAATEAQLTQVMVSSRGNMAVVTLRTTGAFTHTEYRPTENLLLVDMAGVSAATMDGKTHAVQAPNLASYRVLGYKSGDGKDVARVEFAITAGAKPSFDKTRDQLRIDITGSENLTTAAASAQDSPAQESALKTATGARSTRIAEVRNVGVVRGKNGIEVEISANAPLSPSALKLTSPDRVVIDLANATPMGRNKTIEVNSGDVKSIRVARYQLNPPVTRVVIDVASAQDFELSPAANRLKIKLHPASTEAASAPAAMTTAAAQDAPAGTVPAETPASTPAGTGASEPATIAQTTPSADAASAPAPSTTAKPVEFAVVTPEFHPVVAKPDPRARATDAAAKFDPVKSDAIFDASTPTSASLNPLVHENMSFQPQAAAAVPSTRPRYTGEPISVNLKDVDLKDFFRLIHEISGLNVVLDPNVHGTLTIVLDDVPWDQALDIVLKNNELDRQLDGNVLRIATVETLRKEAENRRAQIEAQALAVDKVTVTRGLSYAHAKDVVPTIKRFLSQRGDVVADDRTNILVIDDIPQTIPKIDELLAKLDRKTQQVEIEARVVSATRSFAREIGTQLGFGYGFGSTTTIGGNSDAGHSNTGVTFPVPAGAPSGSTGVNYATVSGGSNGPQVPLFSNLGVTGPTSGLTLVNATRNFRLDYQLSLAESRGLLKILSRPRVVTQNNIPAVVRQGVRVPIVTASQLLGPATVNFVDAFLRLSVTPQITVENTIFLNLDVENTTPDFGRQILGNPTLLVQQATTQVLVADGGTVVIGGVIQTNNSININQVPLLGNIPILGHLFKHTAVTTQTQELIFFITPKIIQT